MSKILLRNGTVINRGKKEEKDVLIDDKFISAIGQNIYSKGCKIIDCEGKWIIPGIIDDQVHFREPGLIYKADIGSESRAALLGGITSFMEMPNTNPAAITNAELEKKYSTAAESSPCNYSFFIGATNDNIEELLKADPTRICGIKAFMGSSTGNLLVDDQESLHTLFKKAHMLIATHCEDEQTIVYNMAKYKEKYGESLTAHHHPIIRSVDGCFISSSFAVSLAKTYNTRLHILHISTEKELELFRNDIPLSEKRITTEVCVHHLFFNDSDYLILGNKIKCNPAIKSKDDQKALFTALLDDRLDIIATDHAPHTSEEKSQDYLNAPSGLPLIQHSLMLMLNFYRKDMISLEDIVRKMCHAPADLFDIEKRGYLDENHYADVVIIDPNQDYTISKDNIAYKCGWSPLEGHTFRGMVTDVFVNGKHKVNKSKIIDDTPGMRLIFDRHY
ncbi:MAG: dihydroorotase [Saprospiraceae bacterium]